MAENTSFDPTPGEVVWLGAQIRRIVAPNPSPMTFRGTNTYLLGRGEVTLLDPGPDSDAHFEAIEAALEPEERIGDILITHSHLDHSPLARRFRQPVYAFGTHLDGRSDVMIALDATGLAGGGEGIDAQFQPDHRIADGEIVEMSCGPVSAIWTPGHIANHMCFGFEDVLFSGDHVMGWATSLVSPPDGDLSAFMTSCARLQGHPARVFHPGHGAPVEAPQKRLSDLIGHRNGREAQILAALKDGPATIATLTERLYCEVPKALHPAAARNVFAHLIDLTSRGRVLPAPSLSFSATFQLV